MKIENAELKDAVNVMRWWLRWRCPKEISELGDEAWILRQEFEKKPRSETLVARHVELLRKLIAIVDFERFWRYMNAAYGLSREQGFFPPQCGDERTLTAIICPRCGPSEVMSRDTGMWDGVNANGEPAYGVVWTGTCMKCGVNLRYFADSGDDGAGKEWTADDQR